MILSTFVLRARREEKVESWVGLFDFIRTLSLSLSQSVLVSTNNVKWDCLTESCSSSWSCHHGCFSQLQTFSKISTEPFVYLFIICPNLLCEHFSLILPHGYAYWWFIPWFVSCFRLWRKDLSINRMNRQPSPATPHNSIYLLYIFQLKPFRTFIWNHALELLKITRHIERDTVPTPLPSKLLWLKMTFLDQNISKSNSETAILLLMEKVETL